MSLKISYVPVLSPGLVSEEAPFAINDLPGKGC